MFYVFCGYGDPMNLVVDTNILFSALYDPNSSAGKLILRALEGKIDLFAPDSVKEELERNLKEKLEYAGAEVRETVLVLPIKWIEKDAYAAAIEIARRYVTHKPDVPILATALATGYDVVSGDKHLLSIEQKVAKVWSLSGLKKKGII